MNMSSRRIQTLAWLISIGAVTVAFVGWAGHMHWNFSNISSYSLFPLSGLLAFSLMWAHYILAAFRKLTGADKQVLKHYFDTTSLAVLAFLLLHPGLLIWQLWRDGFGLPPESYLDNYVAPGLGWVALLGTISLVIFIAYEFRHIYGTRSWWKYVQYASDAAMVAIFYHSLKLGSTLHNFWLQGVWLVYAISFVSALLCIYLPKGHAHKHKEKLS